MHEFGRVEIRSEAYMRTEECSSIPKYCLIEGVASRLRGGVDVSEGGVWAFAVA